MAHQALPLLSTYRVLVPMHLNCWGLRHGLHDSGLGKVVRRLFGCRA